MNKNFQKNRISFKVTCNKTKLGENIYVSGDKPFLGLWKIDKAIKLNTSEKSFPEWKSDYIDLDLDFDPDSNFSQIEYKYLIGSDSNKKWENFQQNRKIILNNFSKEKNYSIDIKRDEFDKYSDKASLVFSEMDENGKSEKAFDNSNKSIHSKNQGYSSSQKSSPMKSKDSPSKPSKSNYLKSAFEIESNMSQSNNDIDKTDNIIINFKSISNDLVKANENKKTWKQKLELVWSLIKQYDNNPNNELLSTLASYLYFINTGKIKCAEDGTHFRPNHHAELSKNIFHFCLSHMNDSNSFILRTILKFLPSFSDQYLVSVPLTRIRDIAHRNDIPHDLKQEIKNTLQNKLHRSAAPEDLKTCENIYNKIKNGNYSKDFVNEFEIFYKELKEFFNTESLDSLLDKIISSDFGKEKNLAKLIDKFSLAKKSKGDFNQIFDLITELREIIFTMISHNINGNFQLLSNAEMELEKFLFTIVSEYLNIETKINKSNHDELVKLCVCLLTNLKLSGLDSEECIILQDLIENYLFEYDKNDKDSLLRKKSVIDRMTQLSYSFTQLVESTFSSPVHQMGIEFKIEMHFVNVFTEGFVRAHLIFQLSKVLSLFSSMISEKLKLPPYISISIGEVIGETIHLKTLNEELYKLDESKNYVLFLDSVQGDEELPNCIKGVILGHDLPQLSHLAIRARQQRVVFTNCLFENEYIKLLEKFNNEKYLKYKGSNDNIFLEKSYESEYNKSNVNNIVLEVMKNYDDNIAVEDDILNVLKTENISRENSGSKCYNMKLLTGLSEKYKKFIVPLSMSIPFSVYKIYLLKLNPNSLISLDNCDLVNVESESIDIREDFIKIVMNDYVNGDEMLNIIVENIKNNFPENSLLAVRSSSNLEDLKKNAGAGLFDSKLGVNINDKIDILNSITQVWASIFTSRGVLARKKSSIPNIYGRMGILVQEMMNPTVSFVIHTINPITLCADEIYIELAYGLGETLASANQKGTPFRIVYFKKTGLLNILNYPSFSLSLERDKENKVTYRRINYFYEKLFNDADALNSLAKELGSVAEFLENEFSSAQDIEGGLTREGKIFLVQTRPQII